MAKGTLVERNVAPATRADALTLGTLGPPRTLWGDAWRRFRRHKLAMAGAVVLLIFILATLIGPLVYRVNRDAMDVLNSMTGSTAQHPMGTDDLGRDLLARVLFGGRVSLAVGMIAMLI